MNFPWSRFTRRLTIKRRLALLFIIFALVPCTIVGAVSYLYARNLTEKYAYSVETLAVETLKQVEQVFSIIQTNLEAVSHKSEFSDVSGAVPGVEMASLSSTLSEVVKTYKSAAILVVTDLNRTILASHAPGSNLAGKRLDATADYQAALQGKLVRGKIESTSLSGKVTYGFWVHSPLYSAWDKTTPIGVLSAFISLDPITQLIQHILIDGKSQDPSRYVELARDDGQLVSIPPFLTEQPTPLTMNAYEAMPALAPLRNATLTRGTIHNYRDHWGPKEVGFARNEQSGLIVLTFVDDAIVYRQIETLGYFIIAFILIILAASTLTALPISHSIVRPIYVAVEAASRVALGDLTTQVDITTQDEMGQLLESIAAMTRSLNSLVGQVKESGAELISITSAIAETSRGQEEAVQEFGTSTNEIVAAVTEISATSQDLVNTMNDVSQVAADTASLAHSGRSGLGGMGATMKQLAQATGLISSRLAVINEKANNINSVITTISKVADQTNLLSLNAAIEAEKAGEFGHGFSVVAREIRRLADQTAIATLDIEEMVKEMQSAVSSGVMEMDRFSEAVRQGVKETDRISEQLGQIMEQVQALTPRFSAVNEGMQSQSQGAQQISKAMVQLSEAARQTALSLKEFNAATDQLNQAVEDLEDEISRFKVI